jgi:hypothetical protein
MPVIVPITTFFDVIMLMTNNRARAERCNPKTGQELKDYSNFLN